MTTNQDLNPTRPPRRLLGIWAHPDDEAYLSADLMARTIEAGGSVTLVTITDGEGGFGADDDRSDGAKAAHRRAELIEAMAAIGVRDIRFLGVADGEVADQLSRHSTSSPLVDRLTREIRRAVPELTVTFGPDGITGHPDHVACSRLATRAWSETRIGELWYAAKSDEWMNRWDHLHRRLGVIMCERSTEDGESAGLSDSVVDHRFVLGGDRLATKRRVLAAHRSQTEMIAGFMGEDVYREWIAEECFRSPTEAELFDADPYLALANWCHPRCHQHAERTWS